MTARGNSLLVALLLMTGCAAQVEPPRQYLLDYPALGSGALVAADEAPALLIDRVRVADFLDVSGIVFQTADNEIAAAGQHRWGEPLERQLRRSLYAMLASRLGEVAVFEQPPLPEGRTLRLSISLDAFQGHYDGNAVIAGTWQLTGGEGKLLARRRFRAEPPLPADGYSALVRALSNGWREIAAGIATEVGPLTVSD